MKIKITIQAGDKVVEKEKELDTDKTKETTTQLNKLYRSLKKELWGKKEE